jgi:hypothetical protein
VTAAPIAFSGDIAKLYEFSQDLGALKCNIQKLSESHRLITTVLIQYRVDRDFAEDFLSIIAVVTGFQP